MRITIGMIVFNAISVLPENMLKLCIENMYDIADEFIIVEGATNGYDGYTIPFTNNGRSSDGTLEFLQELNLKYPKIKIIYKDGFWNGKTEMCNAYASISTGDYLWQLDSDEFYKKEDQIKILELLNKQKPDAVHFYANHFFGGFDYCIDERTTSWGNDIPWMRIFKNKPLKSKWLSHEPPNYICDGLICNQGIVITRENTLKDGIKMYHYSYVDEKQIRFKDIFFRQTPNYQNYWNNFKNDKNSLVWGGEVNEFCDEHPEIIKNNYIK